MIKITSLLGNKDKTVTNYHPLNDISDVNNVLRMCITDRKVQLTRADGNTCMIIENGTVHTDVYNNKQALIDWSNGLLEDYPPEGTRWKNTI